MNSKWTVSVTWHEEMKRWYIEFIILKPKKSTIVSFSEKLEYIPDYLSDCAKIALGIAEDPWVTLKE